MIIQKISQNLFSKNIEKTVLNHSNPFAGGLSRNILTADIFEGTRKVAGFSSITDKLAKIADMTAAARHKVVDFWANAKNTNIEISFAGLKNFVKSRVDKLNEFSVQNLVKRPVADLKEIMINELV